jgi:tetraacyldisaccharide-1-P 4'-kinase
MQLKLAGIELVGEALFRDHHSYTDGDVQELLKMRMESEAGGFITTEKDAVNLGEKLALLEPVSVVRAKMELSDGSTALDVIFRTVNERKGPA